MLDPDSDLINRVTQALLSDPRTAQALIEVHSQGRRVILSGLVSSEEVRQAAEEISRQQAGVRAVTNALRVETLDS